MLPLKKEIEDELYDDLKIMFSDVVMDTDNYKYIAYVDVLCSSEIASDNNYVRPVMNNEYGLDIKGPVIPLSKRYKSTNLLFQITSLSMRITPA